MRECRKSTAAILHAISYKIQREKKKKTLILFTFYGGNIKAETTWTSEQASDTCGLKLIFP